MVREKNGIRNGNLIGDKSNRIFYRNYPTCVSGIFGKQHRDHSMVGIERGDSVTLKLQVTQFLFLFAHYDEKLYS